MRITEIITENVKQRLDPKCWTGKHKEGTKIKGGIRVNNCVPNESVEEAANPAQQAAIAIAMKKDGKKPKNVHEGHDYCDACDRPASECICDEMTEGENWSKYNHKRVGGMSKKSVKSYRRSHPGSKIQTAVTTKPSKLKKGSKAAKRRKSFCARMKGMKKHRTSAKTARDPNSNINKSLRRWNCESVEQLQELVMLAEQMVAKARKEIL